VVYRRVTVGMSSSADTAGDRTSVVWGVLVSGNYFAALGIRPAIGRGFLPDEDKAGNRAQVAVISDRLWRSKFAEDPGVIGRSVTLNGHAYTVVGVTPPSFLGLDLSYRPDIYIPMATIGDIVPSGEQLLQSRSSRSFVIRGLVRPDAGIQQAQAEADLI